RTPVDGAEFVGDFLLVKERAAGSIRQPPRRALGRPPAFAWEAFHVEVADLIKSGRMPQKKEAAIQQMVSWFESTQGGQRPSRSAVSEKLTPYYRRFFSYQKKEFNRVATTVKCFGCCPGAAPKNASVKRQKIVQKF